MQSHRQAWTMRGLLVRTALARTRAWTGWRLSINPIKSGRCLVTEGVAPHPSRAPSCPMCVSVRLGGFCCHSARVLGESIVIPVLKVRRVRCRWGK
jgi:hypothetical protein